MSTAERKPDNRKPNEIRKYQSSDCYRFFTAYLTGRVFVQLKIAIYGKTPKLLRLYPSNSVFGLSVLLIRYVTLTVPNEKVAN